MHPFNEGIKCTHGAARIGMIDDGHNGPGLLVLVRHIPCNRAGIIQRTRS